MTVSHNVQLAVDFQTAAGVVEHLPGDVIGQRVLLVERRITQYGVKAERFDTRQRVVDHKLTAIHRFRHVTFHVQTARSHRHGRFINKYHAGFWVLRQQCHTDDAVTTAEVNNLPFEVFRQMLDKKARADIQSGTGENIGVVMDSPVSAFQLPAQRLRGSGQLRFAECAVDQTGFFPRQRRGGWP